MRTRAKPQPDAKIERFTDLLGLLSARFARISHPEIDAEITHWLGRVCCSLRLDRSVVAEYVESKKDFYITHQWTRQGFPQEPAPMLAASGLVPWIVSRVSAGETVALSGVRALPPEAEQERNLMMRLDGPKAMLDMPLIIGSRMVAAITFEDLHGDRKWPSPLVGRLRLVADIFANALERKRNPGPTERHSSSPFQRQATSEDHGHKDQCDAAPGRGGG